MTRKGPVWVCGARGMLGQQLVAELARQGIAVVATDREVDIANAGQVERFAEQTEPCWIVNCAAYTAVDRAESEPELARQINAEGPAVLARLARRHDLPLVHFSTDYVFDGLSPIPYREEDEPAPRSVYGETKLAGERAVTGTAPRHFVFRIAWLYGAQGHNFVRTMIRLLRGGGPVRVVADQVGSPTFTAVLAENIARLIAAGGDRYGLYHYSDAGRISWYDFTVAIRDLGAKLGWIGKETVIVPIATADYPTAAVRPAFSLLDKSRVIERLGFDVRPWQDNLAGCLAELGKGELP